MNRLACTVFGLLAASYLGAQGINSQALVLDLDAAKGLGLEDGDRVAAWSSALPDSPVRRFVKRDEGRKLPGSGRPTLRTSIKELKGRPSLVFRQQELVCLDEDTFDALTTGAGCTWFAVIAFHEQRVGLKDVNSFFGNLRNGAKYEGLWGCVSDDNTLWWGARNGLTFGRFDKNNPQVLGPRMETGRFYVLAGRLGAGVGEVRAELFVDKPQAVAFQMFPVNAQANASRMAVGQERDAIQHPGHESFDGEIARLLIHSRPLTDAELSAQMGMLRDLYGIAL